MLPFRRLLNIWPAMLCAGILCAQITPAAAPMPPHTVLLSDMMRQLAERPGFTDDFLAKLAGGGKQAALPLTPGLRDDLRKLIVGKKWAGLNTFPGLTMDRLNPVVSGIQVAVKTSPIPAKPALDQAIAPYLDLGTFKLSKPEIVSLDAQRTEPAFNEKTLVIPLTDGVTTGDGPSDLAPLHGESTLLAEVFNRLSANAVAGAAPFTASFHGQTASTPEQLIQILAAHGEHIEVDDSRYFANFGSFNWTHAGPDQKTQTDEIMMPFWLDSRAIIPHTSRTLLVPVSHAQYEFHVSGAINAAVSFWFGIDGKTEFRTMDQAEQRWVMGRHAHVYTGADAVEVARLAGKITGTYARLHLAHPELPFGGYYRFGVCQDVVAAIELKMTGTTTLFPNTADNDYFPEHAANPADDEINALIRRLPKDGHGRPPALERVFGSLPVVDTDAELAKVPIPGLAPDLIAVHDAWKGGAGVETSGRSLWIWLALTAALALVALRRFLAWRQRSPKPAQT